MLVGLGAIAGLAGALALSKVLHGLLFEVTASDPLTYVGVALLLFAVALAAMLLPARRAATVDPVVALKAD
jgi:ABC-type antimicrobial peptide transport system permease subunit